MLKIQVFFTPCIDTIDIYETSISSDADNFTEDLKKDKISYYRQEIKTTIIEIEKYST